jgi:Zn-dependent M16 (insulinase) family peptidase
MTALIDFLLKIFARLVWGSEEEWYRRKKLREMLKTLREHHSDWIDSSGRRLEPGLASSLLNLARNVKMTAALVPVLASLNRTMKYRKNMFLHRRTALVLSG